MDDSSEANEDYDIMCQDGLIPSDEESDHSVASGE